MLQRFDVSTAFDYSICFLSNIAESYRGQKIPLYGILFMFVISNGHERRRDIIRYSGIKDTSFYSIIRPIQRLGFVRKDCRKGKGGGFSRESYYVLTQEGRDHLVRISTQKKGELFS